MIRNFTKKLYFEIVEKQFIEIFNNIFKSKGYYRKH